LHPALSAAQAEIIDTNMTLIRATATRHSQAMIRYRSIQLELCGTHTPEDLRASGLIGFATNFNLWN
jgi:hypothetical protein